MFRFGLVLGLASIVLAQQQQGSPAEDTGKCMSAAFQQYLRSINALVTATPPGTSQANRDALTQFIQSSVQPRMFYRAIWETPISISGKQWRAFCKASIDGFHSFQNCTDSQTKAQYLSTLGLTAYVCSSRVEDFAKNTVCLHDATLHAKAACAKRCSEYENGSNTYLNPGPGGPTDSTPYLILDCDYVNCTATCAHPILQKECPSVADLQLDTLYAMEASMRAMHETIEQREQYDKALAAGMDVSNLRPYMFPPNCYALANSAEKSPGAQG